MNRSQWWVDSGQAAQAAQELIWFVVIVFVVIGLMMWKDIREDKPVQRGTVRKEEKNWRPSTDWAQGGPIIERESICLKYEADPHQKWTATWCKIEYKVVRHHTKIVKGPKVEMSASFGTPLVAAMRCYVASKLGDEVEVPEEVCDENL